MQYSDRVILVHIEIIREPGDSPEKWNIALKDGGLGFYQFEVLDESAAFIFD